MSMEKLKNIRLSVGMLVGFVLAIVFLFSIFINIYKFGDVGRHEEKTIETAHKDIERYVSKRHQLKIYGKIIERLVIIETLIRNRLPPPPKVF